MEALTASILTAPMLIPPRFLAGAAAAVVMAPLVYALVLWLAALGAGDPTPLPGLVIPALLFGIPIDIVAMTLLGAPLYLLLTRRRGPRPWHAVLAGTAAGCITMLLITGAWHSMLLPAMAIAGAAGGMAFWLVAAPGRHQ